MFLFNTESQNREDLLIRQNTKVAGVKCHSISLAAHQAKLQRKTKSSNYLESRDSTAF